MVRTNRPSPPIPRPRTAWTWRRVEVTAIAWYVIANGEETDETVTCEQTDFLVRLGDQYLYLSP